MTSQWESSHAMKGFTLVGILPCCSCPEQISVEYLCCVCCYCLCYAIFLKFVLNVLDLESFQLSKPPKRKHSLLIKRKQKRKPVLMHAIIRHHCFFSFFSLGFSECKNLADKLESPLTFSLTAFLSIPKLAKKDFVYLHFYLFSFTL